MVVVGLTQLEVERHFSHLSRKRRRCRSDQGSLKETLVLRLNFEQGDQMSL
jgi:hypothetical protein